MNIFKFQYPEGGFREYDLSDIYRIEPIVVTEEIDDLRGIYQFKVEMKMHCHKEGSDSIMRLRGCMDFITHEHNRPGIQVYITECRKLMSEWRGIQPK